MVKLADYNSRFNRTWDESKRIGNDGENRVAGLFRSLGLAVQNHEGFYPHDLTISGRIEVKNDTKAVATGNAAIEISYRGNPSGITSSNATGWAIIVNDYVYLTPTARLRTMVETGSYKRVLAGEGATVALVPLADLKSISRVAHVGGER